MRSSPEGPVDALVERGNSGPLFPSLGSPQKFRVSRSMFRAGFLSKLPGSLATRECNLMKVIGLQNEETKIHQTLTTERLILKRDESS